MTREVVGREEELASVRAFVSGAAAGDGAAALTLQGEPGIGKSTLWSSGVERAREEGFRILLSRPAEAESGLAHVGLGDLLEGVLDDVLPSLPPPRRRALEIALLRTDAAGDTVDPRALGIATRTALELTAEAERVLIAIDDVQWFDEPSAHALGFALSRLQANGVLLLLTRRLGGASAMSTVEQALGVDRLERLRVGSLSLGATQRLIQARLGLVFPRPALLHLHEASGGNPFYALELARASAGDGATDEIRMPESLEALVRDRLGALDPETREALSVVAVGGRSSSAMLRAAGIAEEALAPALAARLIEWEGGLLRFTHPLLASALYRELPRRVRQRAHRALAEAVDDPLAQARHQALGRDEPDAAVAADLEAAAALAVSRGATVAAAEIAEHAVRLTPDCDDDERHRRALAAARMQALAGDVGRARVDGEALLATSAEGSRRAEVLVLLSDLDGTADVERAIALRREALGEAASDPALQASIHAWLGANVRATEGLEAASRHASTSLELAEQSGDGGRRASALAVLAVLRFNAGEPGALALAEEGYRLGADTSEPDVRFEAALGLVHVLTWSGCIGEARALLDDLYRELSERDEHRSGHAMWYLTLVELAAGRLALAASYAERQWELDRLYAVGEQENPLSIWVVARVAVHRGQLERARELAEKSRALALDRPLVRAGQEAVLGLVAAWDDQPLEAVARFAAADEHRSGTGVAAAPMYWWRPDQIESLLELGRIDDAIAVLDAWEADARRADLRWVLAQATRCRGLVAAAKGEVEVAAELLEQAAHQHAAVGDPFGRARALLALGVVRRRNRRKRDAREAIEAAIAGFEAIGAAGWAAKGRSELGRIGGRTREEGLTAAERRVAALVAQGLTNREVASALFLGERTVETHLSHVYAKLGVRTRAQLASTFRADEQSSGGLTISS